MRKQQITTKVISTGAVTSLFVLPKDDLRWGFAWEIFGGAVGILRLHVAQSPDSIPASFVDHDLALAVPTAVHMCTVITHGEIVKEEIRLFSSAGPVFVNFTIVTDLPDDLGPVPGADIKRRKQESEPLKCFRPAILKRRFKP
ncbi:MAG: hypothetical protein ACRD1X_01630 [Vicinamibacteria bacterium]